jgi:hypothetical protein
LKGFFRIILLDGWAPRVSEILCRWWGLQTERGPLNWLRV